MKTQTPGFRLSTPHRADLAHRLARVHRVARAWDARWRIPGTRFRFGLDSLLGLLPGLGDAVSAGVGMWLVVEARSLGVSRLAQVRMIGNVLMDATLGAIPILGDAFDAVWKSNQRNARIMERALGVPREPASGRRASRA